MSETATFSPKLLTSPDAAMTTAAGFAAEVDRDADVSAGLRDVPVLAGRPLDAVVFRTADVATCESSVAGDSGTVRPPWDTSAAAVAAAALAEAERAAALLSAAALA